MDLKEIADLDSSQIYEIVKIKIDRIRHEISKSHLLNIELKDIQ
jgi:hypothetical protein